MLSAINAGNTGTNRPHQAGISTAGRYTFAGRVNNRPTLLITGGKSGSRPIPVLIVGYLSWRYVLPVMPFVIIWAAKGIDELGEWVQQILYNLLPVRRTDPYLCVATITLLTRTSIFSANYQFGKMRGKL